MFDKDLLIVDDSVAFTESIQDLIEDERDWIVDIVEDGFEALKKLETQNYKVVLLDLKMPGMSGLDVLNHLTKKNLIEKNYIIVLTGEITIENAVSSLQFGARDFVQKPTVVEFPELFIQRLDKGIEWQKDRIYHEMLQKEKEKAIKESQLIVKSVGHDMSGSYYGSVVLRLQTLLKRNFKLNKNLLSLDDVINENGPDQIDDMLKKLISQSEDTISRTETIIELMKFFKNLGESLKELGNAIAIDKSRAKVFDVNHLAKTAVEMFINPKFSTVPGVKCITNFYDGNLSIFASKDDILRVMLNLIENAYKAMNGEGTIIISSQKVKKEVLITIEDTGCGIPEENLEKIWRPDFTQWVNQTGTGLGLLICRKAVENFDGEISCESEVGKGSKFILKFNVYKSK